MKVGKLTVLVSTLAAASGVVEETDSVRVRAVAKNSAL